MNFLFVWHDGSGSWQPNEPSGDWGLAYTIKERNGHGTHIFFDVKIREGGGVLIGIMALLGVGGSGGEGRNQNDFLTKQNNLFSRAKGLTAPELASVL